MIEPGPEPIKLKDGNFLFLYNSARITNETSPKPGWELFYDVGYVILDKNDPTNVLFRSSIPLFSPSLDWEKCTKFNPPKGLTPNVIFVEGWKKISDYKIQVFYQGCDSEMGIGEINIDY